MKYITGSHALNLSCALETTGDWHTSALRWEKISFKESEESIFKDWGIEFEHEIPEHAEKYAVANHIRAILDLLEDGKFTVAQGMREDFICDEQYTPLILEMVWKLRSCTHWIEIDKLMKREYRLTWISYKEEKESAKN